MGVQQITAPTCKILKPMHNFKHLNSLIDFNRTIHRFKVMHMLLSFDGLGPILYIWSLEREDALEG